MKTDYFELKTHSIFDPIRKVFEFFILGTAFVVQPACQNHISTTQPGLKPFIERYNIEVSHQVKNGRVKTSTGSYYSHIGRIMIIGVFDILRFSKYHNLLKNQEIYKFVKTLRNGAAHDNLFELKPLLKHPLEWKEYKIDNSLHGSKVFTDFINPSALIHLMADISEIIEEYELKKNSRQSNKKTN